MTRRDIDVRYESPLYRGRRARRFLGLKVAGGLAAFLVSLAIYVAVLCAVAALIAFSAVWGARKAGAANEPVSALATEYHSAPGHGPSISAWCHARGIVFGYHPWDHSMRNFQVWRDGELLLNVNPSVSENSPEVHWTFDPGDYVIKYADGTYEVRGDLCTTPSTTTTEPSTTTTSEPPTSTTSITDTPTTTTEPPTTPSSSSSTTETTSPSTSTPSVVTVTWVDSTTTSASIITVASSSTVPSTTAPGGSTSELPHTGANTHDIVVLAILLTTMGILVLAVVRSTRHRDPETKE